MSHFNHAEVLTSVDYLKSLIGPIEHGVLAWPSSTIVSAVVLELDFSLKAPRALHDKVLKCEDFIVWLESNTLFFFEKLFATVCAYKLKNGRYENLFYLV